MAETVRIDPANADQLAAWDGTEGAYWAAHAAHFERAVAAHTGPFFAAARLRASDRVLDIGCGNGATTITAARAAPGGEALGIDLSSRMLAGARLEADREGVANVSFLQADAQVYPFTADGFDIAIARASAMFFGDHVAAFRNLRAALAPGGRIVLSTWQPLAGNPWLREIATALAGGDQPRTPPPGAGPFALSEPDRVRAILSDAGFADIVLTGVEAPMWFGIDPADAYDFILGLNGWMLEGLDAVAQQRARKSLRTVTESYGHADGVTMPAATWVTTAHV